MKYTISTISSKAYWRYIFSLEGLKSILAIFGIMWLIIETLDFFKVYTRDEYGSYAFFIFLILAVIFSILLKRPIKSVSISFPEYDVSIEVRIDNMFEINGAAMISTNTDFEAVTSTFRNENDNWKLVHRHADPIASFNDKGPIRGDL